MVAFLTLGLTKRKRVATPINAGTDNRRHVFERGVGHENRGFVRDEQKVLAKADSPTYINFKNDNSTLTRSVVATSRPESSISSTSSRLVCDIIKLIMLRFIGLAIKVNCQLLVSYENVVMGSILPL